MLLGAAALPVEWEMVPLSTWAQLLAGAQEGALLAF